MTYKKDVFMFFGLLLVAVVIFVMTIGQSTIDIQLHDTYFVADRIDLIMLIVGPVTFLIFLASAIARQFKSRGANAGLIVGLAFLAMITFRIIQLQEGYLDAIKNLQDDAMPDRGEFYVRMRTRINWCWALFGLWITAILIVGTRTVRLLRRPKVST
jgi:hypothetical protein